jgi:hypothetical protein
VTEGLSCAPAWNGSTRHEFQPLQSFQQIAALLGDPKVATIVGFEVGPIAHSLGARMTTFSFSRRTRPMSSGQVWSHATRTLDTTRAAMKSSPSRSPGGATTGSTNRRRTTERTPDPIDVWNNEGGATLR